MNENELTQTTDDEISLIDLFAVLLRYRLLIIFGTLIITLIAGAYLFIAPKFSKKFDKSSVTVFYNVKVNTISPSIMYKLPNPKNTPEYLARNQANRIQFLVSEFKEFPAFNSENSQMSEFDFNVYTQQLLTKKKYSVKASELGSDFDIILEIPLKKLKLSGELVKDIINKTDAELKNYFDILIRELDENTKTAILKGKEVAAPTTDMSPLQNLINLAVEIDKYFDTHKSFLELNETPFVIPQAQGRAKKLVIVCFASLFLFIFLAFFLNAVENIKADSKASGILSEAWKAGKSLK